VLVDAGLAQKIGAAGQDILRQLAAVIIADEDGDPLHHRGIGISPEMAAAGAQLGHQPQHRLAALDPERVRAQLVRQCRAGAANVHQPGEALEAVRQYLQILENAAALLLHAHGKSVVLPQHFVKRGGQWADPLTLACAAGGVRARIAA